MGLSLLAPFFLVALAAVAVPILVHLSDRDRRDVVRFPSLRFLTRLPYRQVRRQRIRHPWLFALRALAIVLLTLAFARPYFDGAKVGNGEKRGDEVVLALDVSYSMGYGDTWSRAKEAVREHLRSLPAGSRSSLLTFSDSARLLVAPTREPARITDALATLAPGARATRLAPALRLANEVFLDSPLDRREVVLISDFQANAWDRPSRDRLLPGVTLRAVDLSREKVENVLVAGVDLRRRATADEPAGRTAMELHVRLVNQSERAVKALAVTMRLDGEVTSQKSVDIAAASSRVVRLGPFAPPSSRKRATVEIGHDALAIDNAFHLVLSPSPAIPLLLVEAENAREERSIYLREALAVADQPAFEALRRRSHQVRVSDVDAAKVVILDDSPFPRGEVGRALAEHVRTGGGLWVILGSRSEGGETGAATASSLLPGRFRETVDRLDVQGISLAGIDYDHPIFEIFAARAAGNLAGPRFYRYRPIVLSGDGQDDDGRDGEAEGSSIARYTDGMVALAERHYGEGRVLLWGSPLDNRWSDLPVHSVFVPFVHQVCRWLSQERTRTPWREVGDVLHLDEALSEIEVEAQTLNARAPSGKSFTLTREETTFLPFDETGIYEISLPDAPDSPFALAVNTNRAESDLPRLDLEAFVAAVTVPGDESQPAAAGARSQQDRERGQRSWWYLILAVLLLLAVESVWSNLVRGRRG